MRLWGTEKTMHNYKSLTARECAERLLSIDKPVIIVHVRPDGDAIGSSTALAEVFRQLGKRAEIFSTSPVPKRLEFILEKTGAAVTYELPDGEYISIDVASPAQLGAAHEGGIQPTLMIDHHAVGEQFADAFIIPEASSAAEVLFRVCEVLRDMGKIEINQALAYPLFAGISSDTGCFSYSNATPMAHRIAAALLECEIPADDINRRLFDSKTRDELRAEGLVASRTETECDGKIAFFTLTLSEMEELSLNSEHFETAIDIVRSLKDTEIAFTVRQVDDELYKVSLRSTGFNVARVAKSFGGGGHIRAAGCTVTAKTPTDAKNKILKELLCSNEDNL